MSGTTIKFDETSKKQNCGGSKSSCRSLQRNWTSLDPVHQCKDLLFENSQLPVLNIIWYRDHLGNTKTSQFSYLLRTTKRVIITVILLILKIGIPIWYILMLVKVPAMFNEMSQFPMGELDTSPVEIRSSLMLYELVYTRGRFIIISYNILVIAIRVAIQALMIFTIEKDVLRCGYWVAIFYQKGHFRSRVLCYKVLVKISLFAFIQFIVKIYKLHIHHFCHIKNYDHAGENHNNQRKMMA